MTIEKRSMWPWVAALAALQLGVLFSIVWGRVDLLKNGREVTVDVVPVDPRDIFRGDYVVLGYPFSTAANVEGGNGGDGNVPLPAGAYRNAAIYVTLAPVAPSSWKAVRFELDWPETVPSDHVVLKGRVVDAWTRGEGLPLSGRIRYGIESYFVPEGTGRELEVLVRDKKIRAVLAVGSDGTAAIKALEVDGRRIHEQPLL
ncbi:MAG: GDYXXLXY domain-containing protein [Hyphomicrobium sp.]